MLRCLFLLTVLIATCSTHASTHELSAVVEVDRTQAYVNEQILVTVRVAAPAIAFNITDPYLKLENVDQQALHKREFEQIIDGTAITVSEIVYAVFSQTPGELKIAPLKFKATLPVTRESAGSNPVITAQTMEHRVIIAQAPASSSQWLPAQSVSFSSSWPDTISTLRAGEPVRRTITVHIEGQHPAAIPGIVMPTAEGVKLYPDITQLELQKSITGLGGTQTIPVTLIVEYENTVTLPALTIDWWNINDRSWKQSTLPAETLTVQSAAIAPTWKNARQKYRLALLVLSLVAMGFAALSAYLWRNRHPPATEAIQSSTTGSEKTAWRKLRRELQRKHPMAVRKNLLDWVRLRWPELNITRLDQLESIDTNLASAASKLNISLYAKEPKRDPDYAAITQALIRLRKAERSRSTHSATGRVWQVLYPDE